MKIKTIDNFQETCIYALYNAKNLVQQEDSYPSSYVAPVILPEQCIYVFSTMTSIRNISYLILSSVATFYFVKYLMGGAKLTRFGHLAFAI